MMSLHRSVSFLSVVTCVSIAALAPSVACGQYTIPQEAQDAYEAAEQLVAEEKYDNAIGEYDKAIELAAELGRISYPEALVGRGIAFAAVEDSQNALKDFGEALDLNPNLPEAYNARGKLYLELRAPSEALSDFSKAVGFDRTSAEYSGNLGRAYAQLGGAQQALQALDRALERYEATPELEIPSELYVARGQAYMMLQDFETAFAEMTKAVEIDPTNHETYQSLGMFQMQAKEHHAAVESFAKSMENYTQKRPTDPPYVEPYLGAALAYIEIGKEAATEEEKVAAYEAAVAECDTAFDKTLEIQQQRAFALFHRGVALRLLGRFGDAIQTFTEMLQLSPEFGEGYFRRGIVWHYLGEYGLAIGDFEQASTINFEDVRPYLWLGFAYAAQEEYLDAINAYGRAIHQDPRYAPAYVNRGLAYVQIEDFEKAIDNFNGAIRLEPLDPRHYYRRGIAQMMLDDFEAAAVSFSIAIEFAPNFVDAYRRLVDCHEQIGNTDLANDARKKADEIEASSQEETDAATEGAEPGTAEKPSE